MKTTTSTEVSRQAALDLVTAALNHADKQGWAVAAAVSDPHGKLIALLRSNDVLIPAIDFAIDKAVTAATMRMSTKEWYELVSASPSLSLGMGNRPQLMVWTGGLPILVEGQCVGGIGVSGVTDEEDAACAQAALKICGFV